MVTTNEIATAEEIDRRVEAADTARCLKRSAAAKQVGELATTRAELAARLDEVDRQLGDVLADVSDVLGVEELAGFTNIAAADLTGWLATRKPNRTTKKKKPAVTAPSTTVRGPSAARAPTNGSGSGPREPAAPRADAADTADRVAARVP